MLFALERDGVKRILPVWHNVTEADVLEHAPILADRLAARSSDGLETVVDQILDVVAPEKRVRVTAGWLDISVPPQWDPGSGSFCSPRGLPSPPDLSLIFDVNHTFRMSAVSTPFGVNGSVQVTASLYRLAPHAVSRLSLMRRESNTVAGRDPFPIYKKIYGEHDATKVSDIWYWFDLPFDAPLDSNNWYELAFTDVEFVQGTYSHNPNNWIYIHPLYDPAEGRGRGAQYEVGGGLLTVLDGAPRGSRATLVPFARVRIES